MNRFTKGQRLLKKKQFDYVFSKAKRFHFGDFLILCRHNQFNCARLGFVISKKVSAKATDRNRFRRLVRESFRKADLPFYDIIFLGQRGLMGLSNQEIELKLAKAWQNLTKFSQKS